MLEDRSYMRGLSFEPRRSATMTLLGVNVVVFLVQSILQTAHVIPVFRWFALNPIMPNLPVLLDTHWAVSFPRLVQDNIHLVWQLFTFQFLHAGILHLLFNGIAIYFFGRAMEESLGKVAFLKLYFLSGFMGGLLQVILGWLFPVHFGVGPVIGASAGAFGLVAAFATMFPEQPLTLLLAFIIPVTMRAKYLLYFSGALALYYLLSGDKEMANGAHLGGMLTGMAFVVWVVQPLNGLFARRSVRPLETSRVLVGASAPKSSLWHRDKKQQADDLPPAEFISREVDPILDKISAQGIQSLTPRERRILEAARSKMDRK
jgi:membrane associated rhomboid family serine protease